ncbi:unnamed protein product [Candidula unifasciata]|uniref:Uncharacterized protein n=1 Tax=Candidula unifasciata TaxID=100452 RepID=A0A8S3ZP34_9EUPU|nr:unnamed protein product [Candidula unifasciata]
MIRHARELPKYTAGFYGPGNRSSFCSFSGENSEKLLESPDVTSETPEVLSDTTQSRENIDQLKLSQHMYRSFTNQAGRCARTLLHRTYMNLKENQLLNEEHSTDNTVQTVAQTGKTFSQLLKIAGLPAHIDHAGFWKRMLTTPTLKHSSRIYCLESATNKLSDSDSQTAKEHFNDLMYLKYQYPNPPQAKILSAIFPEPEKLVYSMLKLAMSADDNCVHRLVVTDHLQQRYWKASLTLSWPKEITVLGLHPERDLAIFGSYLHMCESLKDAGLLYENEDGVWVPMTCEKVMMMLEKLSKYGESSLGCSKGRGFKIILEQVKDKGYDREKLDDDQTISISKTNRTAEDVENKSLGSYLQDNDARLCQKSSDLIQENKDIWHPEVVAACDSSTNALFQMAVENAENMSMPNCGVRQISKPKWLCTIHVGWPFPFSVHAEGLSLPAAQILGYMSVVCKLKLQKLLIENNSELSCTRIEHIVLSATKARWSKNIHKPSYYKTEEDKFSADAKIFCDASVWGFGAFLTLNSTQKVSWFSEEWDGHRINALLHQFKKPYLNSLIGELYALVTAVFTWKHKLRSQRLLCYSDNLTVVSVVNSFVSEPAKEDLCKDPIDDLICILQSTCHEYRITLQVSWLGRNENQLADCLARRDFLAFKAAVPKAAVNKTKAKKLLF